MLMAVALAITLAKDTFQVPNSTPMATIKSRRNNEDTKSHHHFVASFISMDELGRASKFSYFRCYIFENGAHNDNLMFLCC